MKINQDTIILLAIIIAGTTLVITGHGEYVGWLVILWMFT